MPKLSSLAPSNAPATESYDWSSFVEGEYSAIADEQLDEIEASGPELYNDILPICELIFTNPEYAQSMSAAIRADVGILMRVAVPERYPCTIFWSTSGPRIDSISLPVKQRPGFPARPGSGSSDCR